MVAISENDTDQSVLDVRNVSKSFGRNRVLRDVSFRIRRGEVAGIVGENGSGKTTLLKIIVGLLRPNSGAVDARARAGYCPQDLLVFETLTIRENFNYFAAAYGLTGSGFSPGWQEIKGTLLRRFRFEAYENRLVSTLSGGTKQKLNFCLALIHSPGLLILDEPYSGFDWETYLHFWDYAEELKARGCGILIVTHFIYDRSRFNALFELKEGVLRCA
jgi:ABC-type multidrug transport system ATPase subunit